jgi:hypothetical protein
MKRLALAKIPVKGGKKADGTPDTEASMDVREAFIHVLSHGTMTAADAAPPFFKCFDTLAEQRLAGKVINKLDDATDEVELSDEQFEMLKKCFEKNPFRSTRQTAILDVLDEATDIEK